MLNMLNHWQLSTVFLFQAFVCAKCLQEDYVIVNVILSSDLVYNSVKLLLEYLQ